MPTASETYRMLAWAIENRVPLSCVYNGRKRSVCPIILGQNSAGDDVLLPFQFGGDTKGGAIRRPNWRCFRVAKLRRLQMVEAEWQTGDSHSRSQTCVKHVDYDVNETSPYDRRRSLGELRGEPAPGWTEGA